MHNTNKKTRPMYIFIGIIAVVIITAAIIFALHKKDERKLKDDGGEAGNTDIEVIENNVSNTVESPAISDPITLNVVDGIFKNAGKGYEFSIPNGFVLSGTDDALYIRSEDKSTQVYLVLTGGEYANKENVQTLMATYTDRTTAYITEENTEIRCYGYAATGSKDVTIGNFDCLKETGELWYHENDSGTYKKNECGLITVFKPAGETETHGLLMFGFSDLMSNDELFSVMEDILSSMKPYTPDNAETVLNMGSFTDSVTNTTIKIPSDWDIKQNSDGMVIISAPSDGTSIYSGMSIEFFADRDKSFVEDYAQFSAAYEQQIVKAAGFTQNVADTDFAYRTFVDNMELPR